jgi:hypothetical protein
MGSCGVLIAYGSFQLVAMLPVYTCGPDHPGEACFSSQTGKGPGLPIDDGEKDQGPLVFDKRPSYSPQKEMSRVHFYWSGSAPAESSAASCSNVYDVRTSPRSTRLRKALSTCESRMRS